MIEEIKTVSTVEELYKSNGAPTGEIIVDAVVDNVKRTTTHYSADIALLLKVKNLTWLSGAMQLLVGLSTCSTIPNCRWPKWPRAPDSAARTISSRSSAVAWASLPTPTATAPCSATAGIRSTNRRTTARCSSKKLQNSNPATTSPLQTESNPSPLEAYRFHLPNLYSPLGPYRFYLPNLYSPLGPYRFHLPNLYAPLGPYRFYPPNLYASLGPYRFHLPNLYASLGPYRFHLPNLYASLGPYRFYPPNLYASLGPYRFHLPNLYASPGAYRFHPPNLYATK